MTVYIQLIEDLEVLASFKESNNVFYQENTNWSYEFKNGSLYSLKSTRINSKEIQYQITNKTPSCQFSGYLYTHIHPNDFKVGKLHKFWNINKNEAIIGLLTNIKNNCTNPFIMNNSEAFIHCEKLTKNELLKFQEE